MNGKKRGQRDTWRTVAVSCKGMVVPAKTGKRIILRDDEGILLCPARFFGMEGWPSPWAGAVRNYCSRKQPQPLGMRLRLGLVAESELTRLGIRQSIIPRPRTHLGGIRWSGAPSSALGACHLGLFLRWQEPQHVVVGPSSVDAWWIQTGDL
jgi:hypothetical protein